MSAPVRYRPLWSAASLAMDAPSWGLWNDITLKACGYIAPIWVRQLNDGTAEAYELELDNGQHVIVRKRDDSFEAFGRRTAQAYTREYKARNLREISHVGQPEPQDVDASAPGYVKRVVVKPEGRIEPGQYDGDTCHRDGCVGSMVLGEPDDCSCFRSAPCGYHEAMLPVCDTCGAETDVKS